LPKKKPAYRRKAKTKKASKKRASYYEGIRWIVRDYEARKAGVELLSVIFGKELEDVQYTVDQYLTEWRTIQFIKGVE
jgi:hypothetical protein